jgi:hypothetical protein
VGSKTAADTESGKFTKAQAEENGWVIYHQQDPKAVTARGTGGNVEVLVQEGKYVAEKTVDDHLITAIGTTEDEVLEAIRSQQASIDNGIRRAVPLRPVENDAAGNDNEGLASVLPETKVDREQLAANTGMEAA